MLHIWFLSFYKTRKSLQLKKIMPTQSRPGIYKYYLKSVKIKIRQILTWRKDDKLISLNIIIFICRGKEPWATAENMIFVCLFGVVIHTAVCLWAESGLDKGPHSRRSTIVKFPELLSDLTLSIYYISCFAKS